MLDNAVYTFGTALKNELAEVKGKNDKEIERKTKRILDKWLDDGVQRSRFRDPAKKDATV